MLPPFSRPWYALPRHQEQAGKQFFLYQHSFLLPDQAAGTMIYYAGTGFHFFAKKFN
jgi:hypothetical protein